MERKGGRCCCGSHEWLSYGGWFAFLSFLVFYFFSSQLYRNMKQRTMVLPGLLVFGYVKLIVCTLNLVEEKGKESMEEHMRVLKESWIR